MSNTALWNRANALADYIRSLRNEHEEGTEAYAKLDDALADFMTVAENIDRITQNAFPAGALRLTWRNGQGDHKQEVDSLDDARELIRGLKTQHRTYDLGDFAFEMETYRDGIWTTWRSQDGFTIGEILRQEAMPLEEWLKAVQNPQGNA